MLRFSNKRELSGNFGAQYRMWMSWADMRFKFKNFTTSYISNRWDCETILINSWKFVIFLTNFRFNCTLFWVTSTIMMFFYPHKSEYNDHDARHEENLLQPQRDCLFFSVTVFKWIKNKIVSKILTSSCFPLNAITISAEKILSHEMEKS